MQKRDQMKIKEKKPRGLAAVSPERRKQIAAMGGKAVQASGKAYKFTTETAQLAVSTRKDRQK
jgi:uncharacterized protein